MREITIPRALVVLLLAALMAVSIVVLALYIASYCIVVSGKPRVFLIVDLTVGKDSVVLSGFGLSVMVGDHYLVHPMRVRYDIDMKTDLTVCGRQVKSWSLRIGHGSVGSTIIDVSELSPFLKGTSCRSASIRLTPVVKHLGLATGLPDAYIGLLMPQDLLLARPWTPFSVTIPLAMRGGNPFFSASAVSVSGIGKIHVEAWNTSSDAIEYHVWVYSGEGNHPIAESIEVRPRYSYEMMHILYAYMLPLLVSTALLAALTTMLHMKNQVLQRHGGYSEY